MCCFLDVSLSIPLPFPVFLFSFISSFSIPSLLLFPPLPPFEEDKDTTHSIIGYVANLSHNPRRQLFPLLSTSPLSKIYVRTGSLLSVRNQFAPRLHHPRHTIFRRAVLSRDEFIAFDVASVVGCVRFLKIYSRRAVSGSYDAWGSREEGGQEGGNGRRRGDRRGEIGQLQQERNKHSGLGREPTTSVGIGIASALSWVFPNSLFLPSQSFPFLFPLKLFPLSITRLFSQSPTMQNLQDLDTG